MYSFHSFLFFIITVVFPLLLYFETYKNNIKHWFDSKPDCYCWIQNTQAKQRENEGKEKKNILKSFGAKMLSEKTLKKFHTLTYAVGRLDGRNEKEKKRYIFSNWISFYTFACSTIHTMRLVHPLLLLSMLCIGLCMKFFVVRNVNLHLLDSNWKTECLPFIHIRNGTDEWTKIPVCRNKTIFGWILISLLSKSEHMRFHIFKLIRTFPMILIFNHVLLELSKSTRASFNDFFWKIKDHLQL